MRTPISISLRTVILIGVSLGLHLNLSAAEEKPPNILFAFADDWGRYASIYAETDSSPGMNSVLRTPNFDRLAREGALFQNAFVPAPSCTPCRSSLLSGQYFFNTGRGAILQGAVWDSDIPSFPQLLKGAGYHIGETYKVWSPGTPADAQFGPEHAYQKAGGRINTFSQQVTRMMSNGTHPGEAKKALLDEVRKNFQQFLDARDDEQPFCYWFGPTLTHRKWARGSGKRIWGIEPDDLTGKLPAFLPDTSVIREDLADYFGEVQAFDAALGVLLTELQAMGELDNTLIVVSGDHGAPGFPRGKCNLYDFGVHVPLAIRWGGQNGGKVLKDFVNLMDLAPTFLEAAGVEIPAVMNGKSLVPSLRSPAKEGYADPQRRWVITGRERHVAKARPGETPYPQRALRTEDYLYIVNFRPDRWPMGDPLGLESGDPPSTEELTENTFAAFADLDASPTKAWMVQNRDHPEYQRHYELGFGKRPEEELYVNARDPDQIDNRAADPEFQRVKAELREQLLSRLRALGDPRLIDDGLTFEKPPFARPLEQ